MNIEGTQFSRWLAFSLVDDAILIQPVLDILKVLQLTKGQDFFIFFFFFLFFFFFTVF